MSRPDYTQLDAALLSRIRRAPANFTQLQSGDIQKAAEALQNDCLRGWKPAWRYIDARLQALRKAGHISYHTKSGWTTNVA